VGPEAPYISMVGQIWKDYWIRISARIGNGSAFESIAIKNNLSKKNTDRSELSKAEV